MDAHEVIAKLGMFWPLGDPGKLRGGAGAYRQMASDLTNVQAACQSASNLVCTQNQGPPIDGFSTYWSKWQTDPGYFPATIQASNQLADALDAYAQKIDEAHHRIIELATAAAVALGVGLLLTVFTFGGSDAAAGVTVAGLVAASFAEATGLSVAVATIVVGVGVGALEGMVFDGVVQVEATDVFHDQKDFNWAEFGQSTAFGAVTGGLGAGGTMALTRVGAKLLPAVTDAVPVLGRTLNALDKIPAPVRDGGIGLVTGTGFAAGIDEITTGQINPDDLLIGGLAGLAGGAIAGARGASHGAIDVTDNVPTVPQGLTSEQFVDLAATIRARTASIGDDVVIQGSRASYTAGPESDIDIAVRVSGSRFDELIKQRFGTPNPGSAKERTMLWAIQTGKIQAGEAGLSGLRRALESQLGGMHVDISVIQIGGAFDRPPFIKLP